jgi:hypothetical protein
MNKLSLLLPLALLLCCSKEPVEAAPGGTTPAGVSPAAQKSLVDKAKDAAANLKTAATTPLDDKSLTQLAAVAKDLQAQMARDGAVEARDMKTLIAKAKDLKAITEQHGLELSELTGLVARFSTVMGAVRSGNVPDNLKADVAAIEKHRDLKALFQQ